jgi:hypothetical protein
MSIKTAWPVAVILMCLSTECWGLGGELTSPSLAHPSDLDADRKEKVYKLLTHMQNELEFIEGSFINQFSNQRFGATSGETAEFIRRLQDVGLWRVDVQFRDFGEQKSAFTLDQDSSKTYLRVLVNSGREDFKLRDFQAYLPKPALPIP